MSNAVEAVGSPADDGACGATGAASAGGGTAVVSAAVGGGDAAGVGIGASLDILCCQLFSRFTAAVPYPLLVFGFNGHTAIRNKDRRGALDAVVCTSLARRTKKQAHHRGRDHSQTFVNCKCPAFANTDAPFTLDSI